MTERRAATVRGVVQGVGFRPFVASLAGDLGLAGHVRNSAGCVELEIEGSGSLLDQFGDRLLRDLPAPASVEDLEWRSIAVTGQPGFRIEGSAGGDASLVIPPDLASCQACLEETTNLEDRRHRYPFTNCTHCGPRFTIARKLPYDRANTSMDRFAMCDRCAREYADPHNRRYHAQPNACAQCGPSLRLQDRTGRFLAAGEDALRAVGVALGRGQIVALKGLGGYQLLVRGDDDPAVRRLRDRKKRPAKPLAMMVADVTAAKELARIGPGDAAALRHPAAPIVLVPFRAGSAMADSVVPGQYRVGLMLPASPLHALVAGGVPFPLVCTSGNTHDEPICIDDRDALQRLGIIADVFLIHDREIVRRADDSVVHVVAGRMRALRAARGLRPTTLPLGVDGPPILALGGHLKQAPALSVGDRATLWPHVGDLDTPLAREAMGEALQDLETFLGRTAPLVVTDMHPDYATTIWAESSGRPVSKVQHHHAHVASILAETGRQAGLGFAWDGVGYGTDGGAWGGETLAVDGKGARRIGSLFPFPLPGGDAAARDGRRVVAGLCMAAGVDPRQVDPGLAEYTEVAKSTRLAPPTTSVGRLFDGVAALTAVCSHSRYEGEAAMMLEALAEPDAAEYTFRVEEGRIDWRPMWLEMMHERDDPARVASRFHATLAAVIAHVAADHDSREVFLAGGCFANRRLLEAATNQLVERGIRGLSGELVPPGDGGLAIGQAWVARHGGAASCA